MANGILVFIEHADGKINRASYEALRAAQLLGEQLGHEVSALILGHEIGQLAADVAGKKLKRVYTVQSEWLKHYTADGYSAAFRLAVQGIEPTLVLMSHTYQVRDFAPKLAASMQRAFIGDCIGYKLEDGVPVFTRQIFQGRLSADVVAAGDAPHFASFQISSFRGDEVEVGEAAITTLSVNLDADLIRQQPEERFKETKAAVDLTQAQLIVAVGRGIKEQKNIEIVKNLAEALGAELAASRPICDNEWLPMDRQIGSSGQTVSPKLYLAVGISGAIQHLVGMKGARTIVAINKDAEAPIFEVADYGIVGDLFEIVPALTKEAEKMKQ